MTYDGAICSGARCPAPPSRLQQVSERRVRQPVNVRHLRRGASYWALPPRILSSSLPNKPRLLCGLPYALPLCARHASHFDPSLPRICRLCACAAHLPISARHAAPYIASPARVLSPSNIYPSLSISPPFLPFAVPTHATHAPPRTPRVSPDRDAPATPATRAAPAGSSIRTLSPQRDARHRFDHWPGIGCPAFISCSVSDSRLEA